MGLSKTDYVMIGLDLKEIDEVIFNDYDKIENLEELVCNTEYELIQDQVWHNHCYLGKIIFQSDEYDEPSLNTGHDINELIKEKEKFIEFLSLNTDYLRDLKDIKLINLKTFSIFM